MVSHRKNVQMSWDPNLGLLYSHCCSVIAAVVDFVSGFNLAAGQYTYCQVALADLPPSG